MVSARRAIIATFFGIVCGVLCFLGGKMAGFEADMPIIWGTILNRTMIGFMIGISAIRIHYLPHGIFLGFIGSLPIALPAAYGSAGGMLALLLFGMLWGALIEFCTTRLLKAPAPSIYSSASGCK